ncbi:hypothetical protein Bca101_014682 [Brassica carinata]
MPDPSQNSLFAEFPGKTPTNDSYNMTLSPLTFLFLFLTSLPFSVISQLDERSTLLTLKRGLGDPPSLRLWNDTSSPCDWSEITCVAGNVTGISFYNQNFTAVPANICDFPNLETLDLSYNLFSGEFPTVLYNCTKLRYLDLSQNYFNGSLPTDIDRLSRELEILDLSANGFSGDIPKKIGMFSKLTVLNLYMSEYDGTFPSEIGDLSELQELRLAYNDKFLPAEIPAEFGKLTKLKYLWFTEMNLIGEIPTVVFENMTDLEHVDLSANNLSGRIPEVLFGLKNLAVLYLYTNDLTGEIPKSISATNIVGLDLSFNNLTGSIPESIGNLTKLEYLNLFENQLTGVIPAAIAKLPGLKELKLYTNKLTGDIPGDFGFYSNLERFEVSNNQLTGKLPENLCKGGKLLGVVVYSNNLSGVIPESLGNCGSLLTVQLHKNRFSGEFPSGIWTARDMYSLQVSNNFFTGKLPEKVAWNLSRIEIDNNEFSGEIPRTIGSWSSIEVFSAGNNRFSGEIPTELTSLSRLISIFLDSNNLSGELPEEIISWKSLVTLSLSKNKLSGKIPRALGLLPGLLDLDLSENELSGEIPPEIGNLKFTTLNLSSNMLTGEVPDQLDNLAYETSFLNNTNLCADTPVVKLQDCRKVRRRSNQLPGKLLAMIIVIALLLLAVTLIVTFFVVRNYTRKPRRSRGLDTWKLTSFHRVDFAEHDIVSNLMEHNVIGSGEYAYTSKVDEKIDVYSFGVVLLELVTGREGNNGDEHTNLADWSWRHYQSKKPLTEAFDEDIKDASNTEEMTTVFKLGLMCTNTLPSHRPSMKEVLYVLRQQGLEATKRTATEAPEAPLLVSLSGRRTSKRVEDEDIGVQRIQVYELSPTKVRVKDRNDSDKTRYGGYLICMEQSLILTLVYTLLHLTALPWRCVLEYAYTSKVDEKIDVYSFGVVLLELVTGREGNNGDEHTNLADWSWRHYQSKKPIAEAFDEDIKDAPSTEEMTTVFKLGLMCANTLPSHRPSSSMKEVLYVLRQQELEATKKTATEAPEAPYWLVYK